jgi:hypothetical protein
MLVYSIHIDIQITDVLTDERGSAWFVWIDGIDKAVLGVRAYQMSVAQLYRQRWRNALTAHSGLPTYSSLSGIRCARSPATTSPSASILLQHYTATWTRVLRRTIANSSRSTPSQSSSAQAPAPVRAAHSASAAVMRAAIPTQPNAAPPDSTSSSPNSGSPSDIDSGSRASFKPRPTHSEVDAGDRDALHIELTPNYASVRASQSRPVTDTEEAIAKMIGLIEASHPNFAEQPHDFVGAVRWEEQAKRTIQRPLAPPTASEGIARLSISDMHAPRKVSGALRLPPASLGCLLVTTLII